MLNQVSVIHLLPMYGKVFMWAVLMSNNTLRPAGTHAQKQTLKNDIDSIGMYVYKCIYRFVFTMHTRIPQEQISQLS